jgi:hypothetical protein
LSYHTVAGLAADVEFEKSAWVPRFSIETQELRSRVDYEPPVHLALPPRSCAE